ncbi:MAG: TetR/AcrR family transcriptional regulator [Desulfobacterium sp.]|nr:TetR/AcrR family transcriptional regulator [Desulfobacterium sp.]
MSKKDDILNSAITLFADRGFQDASMAEVARLAGVSGATVFYHFKSKEALFLTALETVKDGIIQEFDAYLEQHEFDSGIDLVEGVISFYLYLAGSMEAWFLLLHSHYPYKLALVNSECRSHLESIYNSLVDVFERAVALGRKDGSIRALDTRKTALVLFSMVDGVVRFKIYNLYDTGALFNDLLGSCRKILKYDR